MTEESLEDRTSSEPTEDELRHIWEFFCFCPDLLCVLDAEGRVLAANDSISNAGGWDSGKLRGKRFVELHHGDDRKVIEAALEALRIAGETSFSSRLRSGAELHRPIEWTARSTTRGFGYLIGSDATERRRTLATHHELSSRHEAMLAAVPDIIAETDTNRVYTWLNEAGIDFFGDHAIGKEASYFFAEDKENVYAAVQPLFDGAEDTISVETWQLRKDGQKRLLAWWCRALKDPEGRVVGALGTARDVTEQRLTEEALRDSQQKVGALFRTAAQGIISIDESGRILTLNPMGERMFGYEVSELAGQPIEVLIPKRFRDAHVGHRDRYFGNPHTRPMGKELTLTGLRKDGTEFPVEVSLSHIQTKEGANAVAFVNDISERQHAQNEKEKLEHRLEHATKMEAIGRLAGGIAHDFNNLLTALSGFSEIVLDELPEDHPLYAGAKETFKTCQRSASLVRRLLAVSRRQVLQPQVLDLKQKVGEIEKMLRSVLGEDVELTVKLPAKPTYVKADESQIEQVILNLAVNARDAMPMGGSLSIEVTNVEIDDAVVQQRVAGKPGSYVRITVADTGHGMDEDTLEHIFEPFFTTKERGKGTGLGLATVYGIVKQSNGHIWAYSEPGEGTTFRIYLPRVTRGGMSSDAPGRFEPSKRGSETILVVEDESTVRLVAVNSLRKAGYDVLEAENGEQALDLVEAHPGKIQLVLTDVVMPRMHGPELVAKLNERQPGIKALYMSGHADDALVHHGVSEGSLTFLEKPFTREDLTNMVRDALDA